MTTTELKRTAFTVQGDIEKVIVEGIRYANARKEQKKTKGMAIGLIFALGTCTVPR